ncbi:TPA: hypothetical protein ENX78_20670 [Candidatus Poribacteria bacterium]|nr:hypothetical protein [Candidatus Poribacteria bacterium]
MQLLTRKTNYGIKKTCLISFLQCCIIIKGMAQQKQPIDYVNTFLGVDNGGNVLPGPCLPFSLIRLNPVVAKPQPTSGYATGKPIIGFVQTGTSGTGGGGRYGNFAVMAMTGHPHNIEDYSTPIDKETASAGYYSVHLMKSGIGVELTCTEKVGFTRFTFPKGTNPIITINASSVIDLFRNNKNDGQCLEASVKVDPDGVIEGYGKFVGGWGHIQPYRMYFAATFDKRFLSSGTWNDTVISENSKEVKGKQCGAFFRFSENQNTEVMIKVGISVLSVDNAKENLLEQKSVSFKTALERNRQTWNALLSKIRIDGGTENKRVLFYTGLYRTYVMPTDITGENPAWESKEPQFWDSYLIGPHWSKGWIIENNIIRYSTCSGISLGKYGDEWDNTSANSAEGYVETISRALKNGWNSETIGHHIVRKNTISHCEQAGIVGSLGAAFSIITDNIIYDIHVRNLFGGAEMAGIKLHGAIDVNINHNHIYRTCLGLWLDWMAQGTRISCNLFNDNDQDVFVEVGHGPFLMDNNLFLSSSSLWDRSQGGAYVHNLFAGRITNIGVHENSLDNRQTPFMKPHSTEIAGFHNNPNGDDRYYNNLFLTSDLNIYDSVPLPMWMDGNVYLAEAKPSKYEKKPLLESKCDPNFKLVKKTNGFYLEFNRCWGAGEIRKLVTTYMLGKAVIPNLPYENANGLPYSITTDYFGKKRNEKSPSAGPFENLAIGKHMLKVW